MKTIEMKEQLILKPYGVDKWCIKGDQIMPLNSDKWNIEPNKEYKVCFKNVNRLIQPYLLTKGNKLTDELYICNDSGNIKFRMKHDHGEIKLEITFADEARPGFWL